MTRLMGFELRKVWMGRLFALLVAVLASANLLLLWMGARPAAGQPSAESWRRLGAELSAMPMEQRGDFLHGKVEECGAIINIESYYMQLAYGDSEYLRSFRDEYDEVFRKYEQEYLDKSYSVYTDDLYTDYTLFNQAASEYDTVAAYPEFLADIQAKTNQLAGISIFQNDSTGYDMRNIELTAAVYAGMEGTVIDYYPQKGLYTALSYPFTDLLLLAAMLLLALLLVRQERDSGLLCLVRSQPAGRLKTALAKLAAFALSLLAVLALLYGVNLLWCGATYGLGPLDRSIQSVPALMRCTMSIAVAEYLVRFLLAKWAGAFVMGLWVMLAALAARRTAAGWVGALALPLAMYGIRAAIPATSRLNVIKYANLVSLMQTNELLGNYRNLFWFGWPVGLPLVEWTAAVVYGGLLLTGFCLLFARGQLLPTAKRGFVLFARRARRTRPTTVFRAEGRKLFVTGGAALFLVAFLAFGVWQGVTVQSYIDPQEICYAFYMKPLSGPYTQESVDFLLEEREEFTPYLLAQQQVIRGELSPEALYAFAGMQQKYNAYVQVVQQNVNGYLKRHPGAWLVYESGYRELFFPDKSSDLQDTLFAGLLCAVCFSGLFAMERRGGMDTVLRATPLGRRFTVRAKLAQSVLVAVGIALAGCVPHLWRVLRDYGLPAVNAPAMSISELETVPCFFTLFDLLLFWILCRVLACLCMGAATLWLGHRLGGALPALFLSAAVWCLPPLLALSGMDNGIEWLGTWPLFGAVGLLQVQGYGPDGVAYNHWWMALAVLLTGAALLVWAIAQDLTGRYEWAGQRMDK